MHHAKICRTSAPAAAAPRAMQSPDFGPVFPPRSLRSRPTTTTPPMSAPSRFHRDFRPAAAKPVRRAPDHAQILTNKSAASRPWLVALMLALCGIVLVGPPSNGVHGRPLIAQPLQLGVPKDTAGALGTFGPGGTRRWTYQKDVSVSSAFQLQFKCEADTTFCAKAQGAFQRAAQRITSEFTFRMTVVVDLAMFLPCGSTTPAPNCSEATTLGFATPTQRIPVRHADDGAVYLYPTSLLKQTDVDGVDAVVWPQYDVLARFNAVYNWYFSTDGPTIAANQRDLEMVATHEFMHGLGYGDDTVMSLQYAPKFAMLMPYYNSAPGAILPPASDDGVAFNGNVMYSLSQPSIWNRFTFLAGQPVTNFYNTIAAAYAQLAAANAFQIVTSSGSGKGGGATPREPGAKADATPAAYTPDSVFGALVNNDTIKDVFSQLYKYGTTALDLEFRSTVWPPAATAASTPAAAKPNATQVLETGLNPYMDGSSLAHVQLAANSTPDFLMVYRTGSRSFADAIAQTNAPASGIGPQTRDVMIALGLPPANAPAISRKSVASVESAARGFNPDTRAAPPNKTNPPPAKSSGALHAVAAPVLPAVAAAWAATAAAVLALA